MEIKRNESEANSTRAESSNPKDQINQTIVNEPTLLTRFIGFFSIVVAGAAGWFIGSRVTGLQTRTCNGPLRNGICEIGFSQNDFARSIGGLVGALICAIGVAIVVTLAMRAMNER